MSGKMQNEKYNREVQVQPGNIYDISLNWYPFSC